MIFSMGLREKGNVVRYFESLYRDSPYGNCFCKM